MKKIVVFTFLCFCTLIAAAQKHDYIWLLGEPLNGVGDDYYGNSKIDFNFKPPKVSKLELGIDLTGFSVVCSDSTGNLLFYSNGLRIKNKLNQVMENGDTINPGYLWNLFNNMNLAYAGAPSAFVLPQPNQPNIYFLIHHDVEIKNNGSGDVFAKRLYYTVIDMNANNGLGKVVSKNQILLDSAIVVPTAVKHGNGQDWWIMSGYVGSTKHQLFLLDGSGIKGPFIQDLGSPISDGEDRGTCIFSSDGTKYAQIDVFKGVALHDFNRCSGKLSNLKFIPFSTSPAIRAGFCIFSPDSRFLYINRKGRVWSFDLQAPDVAASIDTLMPYEYGAVNCGWGDPFYWDSQLAPDGKIYYCGFWPTKCLNVMHRPNLPGLAADVEEGGFQLPREHGFSLPISPNYRLGRWKYSQCDTIDFAVGGDPPGFQNTAYDAQRAPSASGDSHNDYQILSPPIPGLPCEGCTENDFRILNDPRLMQLYARFQDDKFRLSELKLKPLSAAAQKYLPPTRTSFETSKKIEK